MVPAATKKPPGKEEKEKRKKVLIRLRNAIDVVIGGAESLHAISTTRVHEWYWKNESYSFLKQFGAKEKKVRVIFVYIRIFVYTIYVYSFIYTYFDIIPTSNAISLQRNAQKIHGY